MLTLHARVLLLLAADSTLRVRQLGEQIGTTERTAMKVVGDLDAVGYLVRCRRGRRNTYELVRQQQLVGFESGFTVGTFVDAVGAPFNCGRRFHE